MNIKTLLSTTLIVSGLFFTQSIQPAMAAAGGTPASVIATRLAPGEVAVIRDGPAGFQIVEFFLGGVLVSTVESGTPNTGSTTGGAGIAQTYAETSAHLGAAFLGAIDPDLQRVIDGLIAADNFVPDVFETAVGTSIPPETEIEAEERRRLDNELFDIRENPPGSVPLTSLGNGSSGLEGGASESSINSFRDPNFVFNGANNDFGTPQTQKERRERLLAQRKERKQELKEGADALFARSDNPNTPDGFRDDAIDQFVETALKDEGLDLATINAPSVKKQATLPRNQGFATNIRFTPSSKNPGVKLSVSNKNAARPWALSFGASYSGLNDKRTNADRDADIYTLTAGGVVRVTPKTVVGATLSFKDGEVTSDSLISTLDGTYYGLSVFAVHRIAKGIDITGFADYTHGENDVNLNGATGSFDTNAFSAGVKVKAYLTIAGLNIDPDASLSFSRVRNDAFLASNGVATIATQQSYTNFSIGGTFSKLDVGGSSNFNPSIGIHAVYSNRAGSDLALINGATVDDLGLGIAIDPRISMKLKSGGILSANANITSYKDVTSWSLGASFRMQF